MCLLLLALRTVPERPWLLLGNRDEFHARATAAAAAWRDDPGIVGGRDLVAGGSWLALHGNGRYAAVTNVRTPGARPAPRSRGDLVGTFVGSGAPAAAYAVDVAARRAEYGPFNLVVGDAAGAWFVSSIDGKPHALADGVHAFSNGSLDDEWPKMRRLRARFYALIHEREDKRATVRGRTVNKSMRQSGKWEDAAFLALLADGAQPEDAELPDTGVGLALERRLAPVFIRGSEYGTRASTLAYRRADGALLLHERRFGPDGAPLGETRLEM